MNTKIKPQGRFELPKWIYQDNMLDSDDFEHLKKWLDTKLIPVVHGNTDRISALESAYHETPQIDPSVIAYKIELDQFKQNTNDQIEFLIKEVAKLKQENEDIKKHPNTPSSSKVFLPSHILIYTSLALSILAIIITLLIKHH